MAGIVTILGWANGVSKCAVAVFSMEELSVHNAQPLTVKSVYAVCLPTNTATTLCTITMVKLVAGAISSHAFT